MGPLLLLLGFVVGTIAMVWIFLPIKLAELRRRIEQLDTRLRETAREDDRTTELLRRVIALEGLARATRAAAPAPAAEPAPEVQQPAPVAAAEVLVVVSTEAPPVEDVRSVEFKAAPPSDE